ncbi:hypothetical protein AVEN_216578-1 [Araneus ventricosus]|uniref:Uncharacterized protein n=1 Tax=Araneus ventricosus TaxID=182803 RepID=A0A4Y2G0R3_ARAVE|nr:hypothetical protein AVEN_216578-1 [Araneus ventricosus]
MKILVGRSKFLARLKEKEIDHCLKSNIGPKLHPSRFPIAPARYVINPPFRLSPPSCRSIVCNTLWNPDNDEGKGYTREGGRNTWVMVLRCGSILKGRKRGARG